MARKKEKKKVNKYRQESQKGSIAAIESNAEPPARKKQKKFCQITYFSYNIIGHYLKDCTKPKVKN